LKKYCRFLPYPIFLDGKKENDPNPLWAKVPSECKDEDYKEFYQQLFPFSEEPLFWIHMNFDYPFNLKGLLYFPKVDQSLMTSAKNRIHLYCNQVFVTDHCPEMIPEFLTLLQGVVDSPDIPLNISRSFLQNDPTVRAISNHVIRKVADKLAEMFKSDREEYEKFWNDIQPFVKFGMMNEDKFFEKVKDSLIFQTVDEKFVTTEEYKELRKTDEETVKLFYTANKKDQISLIEMFQSQEIPVIVLDSMIDSHFINFMEMKNDKIKFARIDSEVDELLVEKDGGSKIIDPKDNKDLNEKIIDTFKTHLKREKLEIKCEHLKSEDIAGFISVAEQRRRFEEMTSYMQKNIPAFSEEHTLVVNSNNPLVKKLADSGQFATKEEEINMICEHVYDLALLNHKPLTPEGMSSFIKRSNDILAKLAQSL